MKGGIVLLNFEFVLSTYTKNLLEAYEFLTSPIWAVILAL